MDIKAYKAKLQADIDEYANCPVSDRAVESLIRRLKLWKELCAMEPDSAEYLTAEEITAWNAGMQNANGTTGPHWTAEETTQLAESIGVAFDHITAAEWNVTCNMVYSDYERAAKGMCVNVADYYGEMAKAFLFDPDGKPPREKLACYYRYIVKH